MATEDFDLVFSIYDEAKEQFLAPFLAKLPQEAKRFVYQACKQPSDSLFAMFPKYYKLYIIGKFNHKTAMLANDGASKRNPALKCLGTFKQIIAELEDEDNDKV